MATKIGICKLREYNQILSRRDKALLRTMKQCRFIQTNHAYRLHFGDASTPAAALRAASRSLAKLHRMGLVQPIKGRIGGVRLDSPSYVWTLKAAGIEFLRLCEEKPSAKPKYRKQIREPSYIFLKHTLEIAELYTRLRTSTNLITAELEPLCWRGYTTTYGASVTLKPDLYAVTATDGYEDHWFFEVDLNTESPSVVMRKCEQYGRYSLTGAEQNLIGVFPRVVWIVPDKKRQASLQRHISDNLHEYRDLFVVITFDDLCSQIISGSKPVRVNTLGKD